MYLALEVNGREAIPVRAIPLLTDWKVLSPDVCANAFAGLAENLIYLNELQAFRLMPTGNYSQVPSRWWRSWTVRQLEALSLEIKDAGVSHEIGYQRWRKASLPLLPAGTFVWKDDFEKAYLKEYGSESLRWRWGKAPEDLSEYQLNFQLHLEPHPEWASLIKEGFDVTSSQNDNSTSTASTAIENAREMQAHKAWSIKTRKRTTAYSQALKTTLSEALRKSQPQPSAREILEIWHDPNTRPELIQEVLLHTNEFKYLNSNSEIRFVSIDALRKALKRIIQTTT